MWVIGRKLSTTSSEWPRMSMPVSAAIELEVMFSCVSMTPFGWPVVPEV